MKDNKVPPVFGVYSRTFLMMCLVALLLALVVELWPRWRPLPQWSEQDQALLRELWIGSLPALPPDPSNGVADDPRAASLGHRLFFDTRLSADGKVACASCHQPARHFSDGRPKGQGLAESGRNTMSLIGSAWSPWLYWDGRRDSLWAQALSPLEDPAEHGINRIQALRLLATDTAYRQDYEALFGSLPELDDLERFPEIKAAVNTVAWHSAWHGMSQADQSSVNRAFANLGKAIAAYERLLKPGASRFDHYAEAVLSGLSPRPGDHLSRDEILGLELFMGKARCLECHNGPLLTNHEFHNTGILSYPGELPDRGRIRGVLAVLADPFNCLGEYSDDPERACPELIHVRRGEELIGAMRTPSLRNLRLTAPFQHKGQLNTLREVLEHYNRAPMAMIGHNEAESLGLRRAELVQLEAFLQSLQAAPDVAPEWMSAPVPGL